jgi:hypothetical protein
MKTSAEEFDAQNLEDAARWELELLWDDLNNARRYAANGAWSMGCDHLVSRIGMFTRLVGPTPWEKIQIPLLEDGTYQRIHAELGVEAEVDMGRVAETRRRIDARLRSLSPQGRP